MTPAQMFDQAFEAAFEDRRNLIAFLEGINKAHVHWKPPDGEWSIHEGVEHILLTDAFFRDSMVKNLSKAEETGVWDNMPAQPEKLTSEELRRREQGSVPAPEHLLPKGGRDFAEMVRSLTPSKESVHEALLPYRNSDMSRLIVPGARYGDLNIYERIIYSGIHDYLHQEQMERVLRAPGHPENI